MINGKYNAEEYVVLSDDEEIYWAGNSRFCSQTYVPAEQGVGLERMRHFCQQSVEEFAKERKEPIGTVELLPIGQTPDTP